jgi:oxygen-independent coproporphyrinogen-3 oxidase
MSALWSELDLAPLKKYDRPGPRYTSYPTAPQFKAPFGGDDLEALIAAGQAEAPLPGLSLYVHVPFCKSQCLYCGCNSVPCSDAAVIGGYVDALLTEMARVLAPVDGRRGVAQLHFGGGTPGLLSEAQVDAIVAAVTQKVAFAPRAEVSIELDPRSTRPGFLAFLAERGFNRVSFGVQDLDAEVQRVIGRVQPFETTRRVVDEARAAGFRSVNIDLIYGLPLQTRERFARTVEGVLGLAPDRVALFNFAYVPHLKPFQSQMPVDRIPPVDEKVRLFLETVDRFEQGGYRFLGLDHFAKPADELAQAFDQQRLHRNFQGYTVLDGLEVLAFGASAISQLRHGFAQNVRDHADYRAAVEAGRSPLERGLVLSPDDRLRQAVIEEIMCNLRLSPGAIGARFGVDFDAYFPGWRDDLATLAADGCLAWTPGGFEVTRAGRLVLRNIAMVFDAYLPKEGTAGYSRTL